MKDPKDLVVLVADKDAECAIRGLLQRHQALGIRPVTYDVFVHPRRDPGCLRESHDFLRPFAGLYHRALVIFDLEGCGKESDPPECLAEQVMKKLLQNGWSLGRAQVIVLNPELEIWIWNPSPHVTKSLGWGEQQELREWLSEEGYWPRDAAKPPRPKEAMLAAMRKAGKPYSSAIYEEIALKATLSGHTEPAFRKFTTTLQAWFGA